MGLFGKLIVMLFAWYLIILTLRIYDEHNGLIINNMHFRYWNINQFINQVTFSIFGTPIYVPSYTPFIPNFRHWIFNTPFMPYFRTWVYVDPYPFIIYY